MRVHHVYTRFSERVRIGDCFDLVDHVVFTWRIFLSYTLRQGVLVFWHRTNIVKSYGVHVPYRKGHDGPLLSEDLKVS